MLPKFLTQMDKNARRAVLIVIAMFAIVAIIASIGRDALNLENQDYLRWFQNFKDSPYVYGIVLATFVLGAFIGVPQWAMIAAMVAAFGLFWGGLGSWLATIISATLNFWMARYIGAERLEKSGGELVSRISSTVRNNGFVTSFVVRLVPTGPFILVNMAAGVSGMKFSHFIAGSALGFMPKILLTGLIITNIVSRSQSSWISIAIAILTVLFILGMLIARKRLKGYVEPVNQDK